MKLRKQLFQTGENISKGFDKAREKLMERLPIEKLRQIPKYRNLNHEKYLELLDKLEILALSMLEFYKLNKNDTT
jgi:hypothetical protein